MKLLEGERALVTGAARGIGRGVAQALREEGAQVLGADIEEADVRCDLFHIDHAQRRSGKTTCTASPPDHGSLALRSQ